MNSCLIYDPVLQNKIKNKISLIADCLTNHSDPNINLMGGKAGEALFWAYYSLYSDSLKPQLAISSLVPEIFRGINQGNNSPSFASGLAGIGWSIEHLKQNGFIDIDTDSVIGNFDDCLNPHMRRFLQNGNYDYLHGALGIGLYYSMRTSNSKTKFYITQLVDELEKLGNKTFDTIAWESNLSLVNAGIGYNLGLSHGIASVISILSRFFVLGISSDKIAYLVKAAVNYLLQNKQDPNIYKYTFPGWISKSESNKSSFGRLSWCYNDLGISLALWQAGQIFDNSLWKQEAIAILLKTTIIKVWDDAGICDAGLCHGTTGIAHIYNRAFKYTGIEDFKESAIYWFEQSLKIATYDDGLAGYKAFRSSQNGGMENNYGLLEGISGIGLAMISAVSEIQPAWDNALLLS